MNKLSLSVTLALSSIVLAGCETTPTLENVIPKASNNISQQTIHVTRWGNSPNWNENELNCSEGRTPVILSTKREKNGRSTRVYDCVLTTTLEREKQADNVG